MANCIAAIVEDDTKQDGIDLRGPVSWADVKQLGGLKNIIELRVQIVQGGQTNETHINGYHSIGANYIPNKGLMVVGYNKPGILGGEFAKRWLFKEDGTIEQKDSDSETIMSLLGSGVLFTAESMRTQDFDASDYDDKISAALALSVGSCE